MDCYDIDNLYQELSSRFGEHTAGQNEMNKERFEILESQAVNFIEEYYESYLLPAIKSANEVRSFVIAGVDVFLRAHLMF